MKIQLPTEYEFLNFDRFDVHVKGKTLTEEQIEQTKAVIASTTNLSLKGLLSRQLGIYYGFHLRSSKQASEYFRIWQATIKEQTSEDYAEACNYLGFAEAIDGGYRSSTLFETALTIYKELEKTATDTADLKEIKLNQAFAMRYIGVTTRRQDIQLDIAGNIDSAKEIFERAFQILTQVVEIQQANNANPIDLAESFHLLGVFYQSRKRLPEAKTSLQQALTAWEEVVITTGAHPIKFVTMQSLGNIKIHLGVTAEAIALLSQTRDEQEIYFGTQNQEDIAKTMHFLGDAFTANKEPLKALDAYLSSLKIKQDLKLSEAIINPTKLEITSIITKINNKFTFDWNDAASIESARKNINTAQEIIEKLQFITQNSLTESAKYEFEQLRYKVATFYLHVKYDEVPNRLDIALDYLTTAKTTLKGLDYYWTLNQLACGYQQKMMRKDFSYSENLHAVNAEVILYNELPDASHESRLLVAFAYCTAAQGMFARGDIIIATHTYKKALNIYEVIGENESNQYLRAKNVYATYLTKAKRLYLAEIAFQEIHNNWQTRVDHNNNLFAGRFYVSYAKALRDDFCNPEEALTQFKTAQTILSNAGAHEFAAEIEQDIQQLSERCKRIKSRERDGYPNFYTKIPSSSQQNNVDEASELTIKSGMN